MKLVLLALPVMLFALISSAADARTQVQEIRDTLNHSAGNRGPASEAASGDESQPETESQAPNSYNRNTFFMSSAPSLANSVGVYRPDPVPAPAKKKKKIQIPAGQEDVGTGQ